MSKVSVVFACVLPFEIYAGVVKYVFDSDPKRPGGLAV